MPENLVGRVLAQYRIDALLGAGGMGVVYRAYDTTLRRTVALKLLPRDSSDGAARRATLREARAASRLSHPNICAIHEVGEADGQPFIVMEFVEGRSLRDVIPPEGLAVGRVLDYGAQIASAVAHAHAHGIVHRDLKPANIVVARDGRVRVLDFGLAVRLPGADGSALAESTHTAAGLRAGTPAYMAPEALRGETPREAGDIWALGVLLYEMTTGRRPFQGLSSGEVVSALERDPAPLPASCPGGLRRIVLRCLAREPEQRYGSAAEVRTALETLAASLVPGEAAPPAGTRRIRVAAIALLALGAIVLAVGAVWWQLARRAEMRPQNFRLVSTFDGAHRAPSLSPDGSMVAFLDSSDPVPQVWVKSLSEGDPRQITFGERPAARPRWSPSNDRVVFARQGAGIWEVPPLGGSERQLIATGTNPDLSDDGRLMVFERGTEIWMASAAGTDERRVDGVPRRAYTVDLAPALSPDGSLIAFFVSELGPNGDLWVIPSAGGEARRLTHDVSEGGTPDWTPDGRRIIFSSARGGSHTLWSISPDGGEPRPLTTGAGEDRDPVVSRDGRTLLYTNVKNGWSLVVRQADTGAERRLLELRTEILWPMIAPDGSQIAYFGRDGRGGVHIFTADAGSGQVRQVTRDSGPRREINTMPRWGGDAGQVYYYQQRPANSFRRIPVVGGQSVEIAPWTWEVHAQAAVHPQDGRIAYVHREATATTTRIFDPSSGRETTLAGLLAEPSWSGDGRSLLGVREDTIVACESGDLDRCSPVTTGGRPSQPGDASTLYFFRPASSRLERQVWARDMASGAERLVHTIGPFRFIDVHFHVSARGEIVWAPFQEGRHELWTATLR